MNKFRLLMKKLLVFLNQQSSVVSKSSYNHTFCCRKLITDNLFVDLYNRQYVKQVYKSRIIFYFVCTVNASIFSNSFAIYKFYFKLLL